MVSEYNTYDYDTATLHVAVMNDDPTNYWVILQGENQPYVFIACCRTRQRAEEIITALQRHASAEEDSLY